MQYVMVFKNHGEAAGASLEHPHSQLIATPIVPIMVEEELEGAERHFRLKKRCIWCDIIRQSGAGRTHHHGGGRPGPRALRAPLPVRDPDPAVQPSVRLRGDGSGRAVAAGATTGRDPASDKVLGDPPPSATCSISALRAAGLDHFHWHLEIIPKQTRIAGFEWGTGFFINPTPPEDAARYLRGEVPGASVS